ncbi:DGQHR domain-containing protein [Sphingomonas albertensis]|uniref:DGQHR domain-containing protein n=1 Tax=Sphingomonas albertensis TaxID=2762591 RepID=A0ABR7AKH0_9SPHN|nr:DGQHR domain-containing protein [Sphingomonas albertensis]MBC3940966.1 DGQHR domain-containing protein [Sphingomonas albertensis]
MAKAPVGKKIKKKVLSAKEKADAKLQGDHRKFVRSVIQGVGFNRATGLSDKEFTFDNQTSDFDDIFVYENLILLAEYTTSQSSAVGGHLKNKKIIYDKIIANPVGFIDFLKEKFPKSVDQFPKGYHKTKLVVKILYCSRFDFDGHHRENINQISYLNYSELRYFVSVVAAIKRSARFEFIHFLGLDLKQIGENGSLDISSSSKDYHGSILPEAHSNFDDGYKVVSFYADPDVLLRTSYVLRADGWRDSLNVYQRMISRAKVEGIRAYLKKEKRVFINNIIVTLPSDVKPLDVDNNTIDAKGLIDTAPVKIKLPSKPNSVGLIDGQHRVFAYYESEKDDVEIAALRKQQNLLVTGIIYPVGMQAIAREKFEAKLFLEINSNQTSANSTLKQAIGMVLDPFSNESIAARTLAGLARTGPLAGYIQQYFYDTDKLKTTSIVSYGLRPLVKTKGQDSIFKIWSHASKEDVSSQSNDEALEEYVKYCVSVINIMLGAVKSRVGSARWVTDKKVDGYILTTTYINSILIVLRMLIENDKDISFDALSKNLVGLEKFDFSQYRSSQYNAMAIKIVETYFK